MKKILLALVALIIVVGGAYYVSTHDVIPDSPTDENTTLDKKPADPRITNTWEMMVGTWSSVDDRNHQRMFNDDGTVVDSITSASGETRIEGMWSLFTSENADPVDFQLNNTDVYIKQVMEGNDWYLRVVNVTDEELELVDMLTSTPMRFGKMNGNEMQDGIEESERMTASFRCDNQSSFVVTFTMNEVIIESEGESNTFAMGTSTSGQVFEDANWSFLFKGETVTVTDKKLNTKTTCTQPFSSENAPMNFGD